MPPTTSPPSPDNSAHVTSEGFEALVTSVGICPIPELGWIRVTGSDRVRWLNGMVTNSVQDLGVAKGCYNFVLSAQGRIQGDGYVFAEPDALLIETGLLQVDALMRLLDRFIIMDDVELADVGSKCSGFLIAGPDAPQVLSALHLQADIAGPALSHQTWQDEELMIIRAYSPLVPRYEVWGSEGSLQKLSDEVVKRGAIRCGASARELLRIAEGTPLFGVDIRDRDLPQETGAARALHFAKGCYLGQEIVERIRSRGNVHRTFSGFVLRGAVALPTSSLGITSEPNGKSVGELTSVAFLPSSTGGPAYQVALGYIRREALASGTSLYYAGGTAEPVSLPFDRAKIA